MTTFGTREGTEAAADNTSKGKEDEVKTLRHRVSELESIIKNRVSVISHHML